MLSTDKCTELDTLHDISDTSSEPERPLNNVSDMSSEPRRP